MWKPVIYWGMKTPLIVNEYGEIRNTEKNNEIAKTYVNSWGYRKVCIPHTRTQYSVHRIVAEAFIENPNNYPYVNHKDGNKLNNSVDNLEWVTPSMNSRHAEEHGLINHARGEDSGANVYPETTIREVCKLLEKGKQCTDISKKTGVTRSIVEGIKLGKIWRHVSKDYHFTFIPRKYYKEANFVVDVLLAFEIPRQSCITAILPIVKNDRMLAGIIYDRRLRELKRQLKKRGRKLK